MGGADGEAASIVSYVVLRGVSCWAGNGVEFSNVPAGGRGDHGVARRARMLRSIRLRAGIGSRKQVLVFIRG